MKIIPKMEPKPETKGEKTFVVISCLVCFGIGLWIGWRG